MMRENFQDAMNLIADDLIEEVDVLRTRKKRKTRIVRYFSMAACLCLVAGSAYAWTHMKPTNDPKEEGKKSEQEVAIVQPIKPEQNVEQVKFSDVILTVEELKDNGFIGTVTETGEFVKGTKLTVCVPQGENVKYTVGSTVNVEYDGEASRQVESESIAEDNSSVESSARYTVYAKKIVLIEGGESE